MRTPFTGMSNMGWMDCYNEIKKLIDSEEFKKKNKTWNPNDPENALSIALRKLYNEKNSWGHKI